MTGSPQFPKLRGADPQGSRTQDSISQQLQPAAVALAATPIMGAPPPPWIYPGLLNTGVWQQRAAPEAKPAYHRDALGYVHARVAVNNVSGVLTAMTLWFLPIGYRPAVRLDFAVTSPETLQISFIQVEPDGTVSGIAPAGYSVIGCFSFLAEQ